MKKAEPVVFRKPAFAKSQETTFFTDLEREAEKAAKLDGQGVWIWYDLSFVVRFQRDSTVDDATEAASLLWTRAPN